MKILSGSTVSEGMDGMEIYILQQILCWKLSFATPSDFINLITMGISKKFKLEESKEVSIKSKAIQICDLLLLCKGLY